ncbi:MAG TPA: porin family protein [Bacteroidota bacterium]|jgi:opacity protein-like surface antigen|nr:porin family protein [Bacteroidota bacterium]
MRITLQHMSAFLITLTLFGAPSWQHLNAQIRTRIGVNAGINFANQTHSFPGFDFSTSTRTGLTLGGIVELSISDLWRIQIEPRYIQKGMKVPGIVVTIGQSPEPVGTIDAIDRLDYFEIPLQLKAISTPADIRFFGYLGPSVGFLLTAKETAEGYPTPGYTDTTRDITSFFNNIDFSLDAGGGAEFRISPDVSLYADARYSHGLVNISDSDIITTKSYGFQMHIGALFDL